MKAIAAIFTVAAIVLAFPGAYARGEATDGGGSAPAAENSANFADYVEDGPQGNWAGYLSDDRSAGTDVGFITDELTWSDADGGCAVCNENFCDRLIGNAWVRLEAMHAYARGRHLPPLLTTGSVPATAVLPNGQILFGNDNIGSDLQGAGRVSFGSWFDSCQILGVGVNFFSLQGEEDNVTFSSDDTGFPVLARPFFDTRPGRNRQAVLTVAAPNLFDGGVEFAADNDVLAGDVYGRLNLTRGCRSRLDLIGGYQFARIDDSLGIRTAQTALAGSSFPFPQGTELFFEDQFDAYNEFHGGEVGAIAEYCFGRITLSAMGKVAFGNMRRTVTIAGRSAVTDIGGSTTEYEGGLLALGSNLGTYESDRFSVMPEADLKLAYHVTDHIDFTLGYMMMYWTAVALAPDQIDTTVANTPTVNSSQLLGGTLVGPNHPVLPKINDTDFWVQGITFGVAIHH